MTRFPIPEDILGLPPEVLETNRRQLAWQYPLLLTDPTVQLQLEAMRQPAMRWPAPGVSQPVQLPPALLQALGPNVPVPMPSAPAQGLPLPSPPMPQFVDEAPPLLGLQEYARQPASVIAGAMPPAATQPLGMLPPFLSEGARPGITDPIARPIAGAPPMFEQVSLPSQGISGIAPDVPLSAANLSSREIQRQEVLARLAAEAAQRNAEDAALLAQRRQAAESLQAAAPPAFGYDPMAWMFTGSPQEYMAKALAAKDAAMAGTLPPFPKDAGITSKEAYVAKTGRREYPLPGPWVGPARPSNVSPGVESAAKEGSAGYYMPLPMPTRKPRERAIPIPEATRRELVTAQRRGQTPSGYRMDIGTPSPVDVAATIGAQGAQVHPQVLGPMLAQQQQAADQNAQASVLVALLRGYGEAGQPIPPTIQRQAMDFLNRGRGLPPTIPSAPGAGQESSAIQRFQTVAAEKGKSEEGDRVLASGDPQQITNFGKRIGLDDQTTNEVVAALEEQPGAVWEMLDRLGKQIPELPLGFGAGPLKQPFVSSFGLLGILPDAPSTLQESGIPTEQLQKVERLLREGSPQEKAWARKWLDGYYSLEQKRGELLRTAGGELP